MSSRGRRQGLPAAKGAVEPMVAIEVLPLLCRFHLRPWRWCRCATESRARSIRLRIRCAPELLISKSW